MEESHTHWQEEEALVPFMKLVTVEVVLQALGKMEAEMAANLDIPVELNLRLELLTQVVEAVVVEGSVIT